jgi:hypothetical protein
MCANLGNRSGLVFETFVKKNIKVTKVSNSTRGVHVVSTRYVPTVTSAK